MKANMFVVKKVKQVNNQYNKLLIISSVRKVNLIQIKLEISIEVTL